MVSAHKKNDTEQSKLKALTKRENTVQQMVSQIIIKKTLKGSQVAGNHDFIAPVNIFEADKNLIDRNSCNMLCIE